MSIEIAAIAPALPATALQGAQANPTAIAPSVYDVSTFERAYNASQYQTAPAAPGANGVSPTFDGVIEVFQRLDNRMQAMGEYAFGVNLETTDLTPGQIIQMTAQCHQFMFTCELTSNVANRTSEGVQQLFRQQS